MIVVITTFSIDYYISPFFYIEVLFPLLNSPNLSRWDSEDEYWLEDEPASTKLQEAPYQPVCISV